MQNYFSGFLVSFVLHIGLVLSFTNITRKLEYRINYHINDIGDLNKLMKPYTLHQNTIVFMGAGSISSIAKKYLNN